MSHFETHPQQQNRRHGRSWKTDFTLTAKSPWWDFNGAESEETHRVISMTGERSLSLAVSKQPPQRKQKKVVAFWPHKNPLPCWMAASRWPGSELLGFKHRLGQYNHHFPPKSSSKLGPCQLFDYLLKLHKIGLLISFPGKTKRARPWVPIFGALIPRLFPIHGAIPRSSETAPSPWQLSPASLPWPPPRRPCGDLGETRPKGLAGSLGK